MRDLPAVEKMPECHGLGRALSTGIKVVEDASPAFPQPTSRALPGTPNTTSPHWQLSPEELSCMPASMCGWLVGRRRLSQMSQPFLCPAEEVLLRASSKCSSCSWASQPSTTYQLSATVYSTATHSTVRCPCAPPPISTLVLHAHPKNQKTPPSHQSRQRSAPTTTIQA